jgi:hypothetical protein
MLLEEWGLEHDELMSRSVRGPVVEDRMNRRGGPKSDEAAMALKRRSRRFSNTLHSLLSEKRSGAVSFDLVRLGAHGALLAGAAWMISNILTTTMPNGRSPELYGFVSLTEALYLVALAGTVGGVIGLHARQRASYGRLGTAGFFGAFTGTLLLLVGLTFSFVSGSLSGPALLDPILGVGLWVSLLGFLLMGIATLRLRVLPQWCGVLLIVSLPIAIASGDFGGGAVLGLLWLAVGYALLSQRDVSALLRPGRK